MTKIHRWTQIASVKKAERRLAEARHNLESATYLPLEDRQKSVASAENYLAYAKWVESYIAAHDCTPVVSDSKEDAWGDRSANVTIDGVKYRAFVSHRGNPRRMAFSRAGTYGFHWFLNVKRLPDYTEIYDEQCEKSTALAASVLKIHLSEIYRALPKEGK